MPPGRALWSTDLQKSSLLTQNEAAGKLEEMNYQSCSTTSLRVIMESKQKEIRICSALKRLLLHWDGSQKLKNKQQKPSKSWDSGKNTDPPIPNFIVYLNSSLIPRLLF